jgi:hypothetical protein
MSSKKPKPEKKSSKKPIISEKDCLKEFYRKILAPAD